MNKRHSRQSKDKSERLKIPEQLRQDSNWTPLDSFQLFFDKSRSDPQDMSSDVVALKRLGRAEKELGEIKDLIKGYKADQDKLERKSAEISDTNRKLHIQIDESASRLNEMNSQMKNDKLQSIQILALFVAFFTFVSVEFQFFSVARSSELIIALTLILLSSLMLFVSLTFLGLAYYATAEQEDTNKRSFRFNKGFLICLSIVAAIGLTVCAVYAHNVYSGQRLGRATKCENLMSEIRSELENVESKQTSFLKEVYLSECEQ